MAAVTPRRKRCYNSLQLVHENPMKRLRMEFAEEASAEHSFLSPTKKPSSFQDKENQHLLQRSTSLEKLNTSPLQTADAPKGRSNALPQKTSPVSGAMYSSTVSISSFYSKVNTFQSILERKQANECNLNSRNDDANLPVANKTEVVQAKIQHLKTSKRLAVSRQAKTLSRNTKKAKMETAVPKPKGKENNNYAVEKKMEGPSRVLSMKFKPVLRLQTGAAFFATGKKWNCDSKKLFSPRRSLQFVNNTTESKKQDSLLTYAKMCLPAESKAAKSSREENQADVSPKESLDPEDGKRLACNKSHIKDPLCELNPLQNSELLQIPQSGSSESPAQKETDAGIQVLEGTLKESSESTNKYKIASSILADSVHPLFRTSSSNKKSPQTLPGEQPSSHVELSPVRQKSPSKLRISKKTKVLTKGLKDQMVIDAGQKHFGATTCKSCGMVYSAANPEDEAYHLQYHQRFIEGIKYVSWKNEHVVAEFWDGKIVLILQNDPKHVIKKADDVRKLVDNELGFKQVVQTYPSQTKTYLFVSNEKKIVGCLIAEPVRQAFRVLSEPETVESPTKNSLEHQRAWCCSTKPEKVYCGISRIWVFSLMRRKCIASRLVDVMRQTFSFGCYLSINEIAFSDPTPDGKLFAAKYCKVPNFLVYNFIS
ncbi:N-acetyltransferase ESCO2 [Candoia aspera]|uniref:N-acetyltransferase ESCO2 n=1 Tax=Candoia aspera TaxID=51853 RepID=UPI002FD82ABF